MILTITLNPCIDKSSRVELFKPDSKLRCSEVVREPGGGGINVSKALKRLRTSSVALFTAGGHNGNMLCSLLDNAQLAYHAIRCPHETRENWAMSETSTNRQYRFNFPGSAMPQDTIDAVLNQIPAFSPSFVVASGSLPPGLPEHCYALIIRKAAEVGARCIIDTSGDALLALKGERTYMIKPNIGELCKIVGAKWLEKHEVPVAARQAIADGFAQIVVVSMGPDGAWLVSKDESYCVSAPFVERKSTVGAGDSMVAGIAHSLQNRTSLEQALHFGVACGSAATMHEGTRLFDLDDVTRLNEEINARRSTSTMPTTP